jgi:antitoxin HicB
VKPKGKNPTRRSSGHRPVKNSIAGPRDGGSQHTRIYDFKVMLEPDETGGYVAVCPALAGCYSQGETVQDAMANIKEAIELCLEDMRGRGEPIPDPSGVLMASVVVIAR